MTGETASERNVRRYWEEVWSTGNVDAASDFYAASFRLNGSETSPARFAEGARRWLGHFSGFSVELDMLFSCGDRVVSRVIYRATHSGDFRTLPASGRTFELSGIDVFEFGDDGRVVDHWHETDHWDMFEQLGAEPRPRPA